MTTCDMPTPPCYCLNVRNLARTLTQFYDRELEPSGLRITQYALLRRVQMLEPASMQTLTEATGLERTTLVRNLNVLARAGLIIQYSKAASKAAHVRLTPAGVQALALAAPFWKAAQAKLDALLTETERAVLPDIMHKLHSCTNPITAGFTAVQGCFAGRTKPAEC